MTTLVFVYGSLKRGFGNHPCLQGAQYVGDATLPSATMLDLGAFPALIPGETNISGEIYQVTLKILERLDRLEGHPHFYVRSLRNIFLKDGRGMKDAWCYFLSVDSQAHYQVLCPVVKTGIWNGHGK